jgi:hypothetical protein
LRSYAAEAGLSGGRRTGADGSELQPELQPPVDHSVPSAVIGTYELKEDQAVHRRMHRHALSCAIVVRR